MTATSSRVLRYLDRPLTVSGKPDFRSADEVFTRITDYNDGVRVRHWADSNSVKVHNEQNVLRVETTISDRPHYLVENMVESRLKRKLEQCSEGSLEKTDFSIGHRGAGLQFPEHTKESYEAAARMGAGIIECDVTFTKDLGVKMTPELKSASVEMPYEGDYTQEYYAQQVIADGPPAARIDRLIII